MVCTEYYKGHAGWDSSVQRWRDEDGRFTAAPCGCSEPCDCYEEYDDYSCGEEEDSDVEPACGCYTGRRI